MATMNSLKTGATPDKKQVNLEKKVAALEQSISALSKKVAALEARPAVAAGSSDGVSRHEWSVLLKKLGSYIGFRLH